MNKEESINLLKTDVDKWNEYRSNNPTYIPDLHNANLSNAYLYNANLSNANLHQPTLERQEYIYNLLQIELDRYTKVMVGLMNGVSKHYGELEDSSE